MNQITLHGKLGKDPETSFTQDGKQVTKFSMATDNGKDSITKQGTKASEKE